MLFFNFSPLHRKGDQPEVVHSEGPAAFVRRRLLPIHRLADDAALQQSGGVDRLLQAGLCVPLTGASSPVSLTHTHTPTLAHTRTDSYILHAQSDPICTQPVDHLLPHSADAQAIFTLVYLHSLFFPLPACILNTVYVQTDSR